MVHVKDLLKRHRLQQRKTLLLYLSVVSILSATAALLVANCRQSSQIGWGSSVTRTTQRISRPKHLIRHVALCDDNGRKLVGANVFEESSNTYFPRLYLDAAQHYLIIQAVEYVHNLPAFKNATAVDVLAWLLPAHNAPRTSGLASSDDLAAIAGNVTCKAYYADGTVAMGRVVVRQEAAYVRVLQVPVTVVRCALSRDAVPVAIRLKSLLPNTWNKYRQPPSREPFFSIVSEDTHPSNVTLYLCQRKVRRQQSALCTSPQNRLTSSRQVVQWIDWHLFVGFDVVYFYDRDGSHFKALQPYIKAGRLEYNYHPWGTTSYGNFYVDQNMVARLCATRARYTDTWMLFTDVDEFLHFPHPSYKIQPPVCSNSDSNATLLNQYFHRMARSMNISHVGSIGLPATEYGVLTNASEKWLVNRYTKRKQALTWQRTKVLSRPYYLKELWVHSVQSVLPKEHKGMSGIHGPVTLAKLGQMPMEDAIHVAHYFSMTKNRTKEFLTGEHLISDGTFAKLITTAIDEFKTHHSWPIKPCPWKQYTR